MLLLTAGHPDEPVFDMALTHALLRGVARGDLPELARIYHPGPTMAFGRLDALRPGYGAARDAATARGWAPVLRLGGGHAAGYDQQAVVLELVTRHASIVAGTTERFAAGIALLQGALTHLGVATQLGELPGEYCPGRWSLHLPDGPKVVGAAQRSIRGASLFTAVVVVGGGAHLHDTLLEVYDALELAWNPATAGAIDDKHQAISAQAVLGAICEKLGPTRETRGAPVPPTILAHARQLTGLHR